MYSNLPPGCRDSDIPGNRPEDEAFDYFIETKEEELKGLSEEEVEKQFEIWYEIKRMSQYEFNDHLDDYIEDQI